MEAEENVSASFAPAPPESSPHTALTHRLRDWGKTEYRIIRNWTPREQRQAREEQGEGREETAQGGTWEEEEEELEITHNEQGHPHDDVDNKPKTLLDYIDEQQSGEEKECSHGNGDSPSRSVLSSTHGGHTSAEETFHRSLQRGREVEAASSETQPAGAGEGEREGSRVVPSEGEP